MKGIAYVVVGDSEGVYSVFLIYFRRLRNPVAYSRLFGVICSKQVWQGFVTNHRKIHDAMIADELLIIRTHVTVVVHALFAEVLSF